MPGRVESDTNLTSAWPSAEYIVKGPCVLFEQYLPKLICELKQVMIIGESAKTFCLTSKQSRSQLSKDWGKETRWACQPRLYVKMVLIGRTGKGRSLEAPIKNVLITTKIMNLT